MYICVKVGLKRRRHLLLQHIALSVCCCHDDVALQKIKRVPACQWPRTKTGVFCDAATKFINFKDPKRLFIFLVKKVMKKIVDISYVKVIT